MSDAADSPTNAESDDHEQPADAAEERDEVAAAWERARDRPRNPRSHTPEQWEVVGHEALFQLFERTHDDLTREFEETMTALEYDHRVNADHVIRLRDTLAAFECVVEDHLAYLADETETWEHTAERVPDSRLRRELGSDPTEAAAESRADREESRVESEGSRAESGDSRESPAESREAGK